MSYAGEAYCECGHVADEHRVEGAVTQFFGACQASDEHGPCPCFLFDPAEPGTY